MTVKTELSILTTSKLNILSSDLGCQRLTNIAVWVIGLDQLDRDQTLPNPSAQPVPQFAQDEPDINMQQERGEQYRQSLEKRVADIQAAGVQDATLATQFAVLQLRGGYLHPADGRN